jgi:hypothetical protein
VSGNPVLPRRVTRGMTISRLLVLPAVALALAVPLAAPGSAAPAPEAREVTLLTWHGHDQKVTLPVDQEMIPGAPRSFRRFARAALRAVWIKDLGQVPACRTSPTFYVRALRTDGFALGGAGTYPRPGCATGGGYAAFWAIRHGEWKQVIGTQDVVGCARLEKVGFPSELGVHECYDGHDVVPYSHP